MQKEKAERITITLPPDMLASIKRKVNSGSYASDCNGLGGQMREAMK